MATLNFNIKPVGNGELQIMAVIRNGEFLKRKYTGFTIPDKKQGKEFRYWSKSQQRVKGLPDFEDTINSKLNKWEGAFTDYMLECKRIDKLPSIEEILVLLGDKPSKRAVVSNGGNHNARVIDVVRQFIDAKKLTHRNSTINRYRVIIEQFTAYEKHVGKQIVLSDIDKAFYAAISEWFITKQSNTNNTVQRKIKMIKTIMNYAFDEGLIKTRDFAKSYRLKQVESNRYPLYAEEVETLRKYQTTNLNWRLVLDAFLFSVETGLRYSDVKQLNASHIKVVATQDGNFQYIDLHTTKTDKRNTVPLSEAAMTILNKYLKGKGQIFPLFTDQGTNRILKDIFEDAGLNRECEKKTIQGNRQVSEHLPLYKLATFHLARHTYATLLILKGVPLKFVQDNMGHADIKTTMVYTRNSDMDRMMATIKVLNG
jgi:site-specific recombinase XerD